MLTRIVHNSPSLGKFFDQLIPEQDWQRGGLPFSAPQRQHILEVADALLVCPEAKTLAALQRQYVETTDVSNWADSFRIAPWSADELRSRLRAFLVHWATTRRTSPHPPPPILLSLDDSLGEKDRATCHLEPVDWHYDHRREYQEPAALQERRGLSGVYAARRCPRMYGGCALVSAPADRPPSQPKPSTRTAAFVHQQDPPGASDAPPVAPPLTERMAGLCPDRLVVCFGAADQVHPPSGLACGGRP